MYSFCLYQNTNLLSQMQNVANGESYQMQIYILLQDWKHSWMYNQGAYMINFHS